jgi:hypothetical protein
MVAGGLAIIAAPPAVASDDPIPPAGQHGEPFEFDALLLECERVKDSYYCLFEREGYWYFAFDEPRTPQQFFNEMRRAAKPSRFQVAGDMIESDSDSARITVRSLRWLGGGRPRPPSSAGSAPSASTETPGDRTFQALIGRWRSVDDADSEIRLADDGTYEDIYAGDVLDRGTFSLTDACLEDDGGYDGLILVVSFAGETPFCYVVSHVDSLRLSLLYISRGNTLMYRRVAP